MRDVIRPAREAAPRLTIGGTVIQESVTSVPLNRRYLWLIVLALVVATALVVVARRRAAPAGEDCEKKPPPSTFAVAECDAGTAPAARP